MFVNKIPISNTTFLLPMLNDKNTIEQIKRFSTRR
jgi:hypothetical protein